MNGTPAIFELINDECEAQLEKWGHQHHEDSFWLLILMEEVGEAAQAFLQHRRIDAVFELVQCAAVVVSWLEDVLGNQAVFQEIAQRTSRQASQHSLEATR